MTPRRTAFMARREFLWQLSGGAAGLGVLASGCRGGTEPEPFPHLRLAARPRSPIASVAHGYTDLNLGNPLIGRDGFVYVPPGYSASTPAPLLVLLHGGGGSSVTWRSETVRSLVDPLGVIVLAPDSRGFLSWDLVDEGDYGADVQFIDQALAWTFERCRIDAARVGLGGFSDGATECIGLGVANGDLFSTVMAFSPGDMYAPVRRGNPRVFVAHGTQDPVFPIATTRDMIVPALTDLGLTVEFSQFDGSHELPEDVAARGLAILTGS